MDPFANLSTQQRRLVDDYILRKIGKMALKAVPSSTPTANYAHGPGGILSHPALEQPLYSAVVTPWTGLQYILPVRGTTKTDPLYGIVTGVTATSGSEPTGVCDDPPTVGLAKICMQSYNLGRESRQTSVLDISRGDRITDRGEHTDFVVYGNPFGADRSWMVPGISPELAGVGMGEGAKRMLEFMVAWSRDFAGIIYTGNPTNNTSGGGYREPQGLDIIINTGKRDAETGTACAAADSIVRSFGSVNISTGTAVQRGELVRLISYIYRNLQQNAGQMNLAPLELVLVMRFSLFYELSEIWPTTYATYRDSSMPTGSTNFVNNLDAQRMRDDMRADLIMRSRQYLLIDGQKVPVIIDDAIAENTLANGAFSSSIYFVPLRILGGREVTFIEYFDYAAANVLRNANLLVPDNSYSLSDNGRFLIHKKPPTNFCTQLVALTEWRVICTTPHLAGRITNIAYSPLIHERSGDTSSNYFVNGGHTSRTGSPSYYTQSS